MHGYTIFCWLYVYLLVRELVNNYKDLLMTSNGYILSKINNNYYYYDIHDDNQVFNYHASLYVFIGHHKILPSYVHAQAESI